MMTKLSYTLFVILLVCPTVLFGQNEKLKRWTISISGGGAFPVGSYANDDASGAAIYYPGNPDYVLAFDKSKSGFAKTGYYFNCEVDYKLKSALFFLLRSGKMVNAVETSTLIEFYEEKYPSFQDEIEHDDYDIGYITPGIGVIKTMNAFDLGLSVFAGYARAKYPYYKRFDPNDPTFIWAHKGDRPHLKTIMYGSEIFARYIAFTRMTVGIEASFQMAQFDYKISNQLIPGASDIHEIENILKVSTVNIGVSLGYKF